MKIITNLVIIFFLSSCSGFINNKVPISIEADLIDKIYIKKPLYGTDSLELSSHQRELFVNEWNHGESKGVLKMPVEFWITVKLKNESTRNFRVFKDLIKEQNDWAFSIGDSTLIDSFWNLPHFFQKPEDFTPLTFLSFASENETANSIKSNIGMTMTNEFPVDWVKEKDLDGLFGLLDSKEKCACFVNPFSSYLPNDKAEIGGFAGLFIKSFKEGQKIDFGLYACPEINEELNVELRTWRRSRKK